MDSLVYQYRQTSTPAQGSLQGWSQNNSQLHCAIVRLSYSFQPRTRKRSRGETGRKKIELNIQNNTVFLHYFLHVSVFPKPLLSNALSDPCRIVWHEHGLKNKFQPLENFAENNRSVWRSKSIEVFLNAFLGNLEISPVTLTKIQGATVWKAIYS